MAHNNLLEFRSARAGGASVLALDGSLDGATAPLLDARLEPLLGGAGPRLLLDFSDVGTSAVLDCARFLQQQRPLMPVRESWPSAVFSGMCMKRSR